jgi:hypothetical protein
MRKTEAGANFKKLTQINDNFCFRFYVGLANAIIFSKKNLNNISYSLDSTPVHKDLSNI